MVDLAQMSGTIPVALTIPVTTMTVLASGGGDQLPRTSPDGLALLLAGLALLLMEALLVAVGHRRSI